MIYHDTPGGMNMRRSLKLVAPYCRWKKSPAPTCAHATAVVEASAPGINLQQVVGVLRGCTTQPNLEVQETEMVTG